MLTYSERIELRNKLTSGEIGIALAMELYWKDFDNGRKSWHTKDWKERRDKLIKEECQICNSSDTLTLQHLSHPKKYSDYLTEVRRAYAKEYIRADAEVDGIELKRHIHENYIYTPTAFCPHCKNSKPSIRMRKEPKYRCTYCKHEFDVPVYISIDDLFSIFLENQDAIEVRDKCFFSKKWNNEHNIASVKYWFQREQAVTKDSAAIEKEAFLLYLDDDIRYLSFEDTITACRRCASHYDLNRMDLCPKCKLNYKGIQYLTCIQCLPEDRRKSVLESIEFGNEMRKVEKDLGND